MIIQKLAAAIKPLGKTEPAGKEGPEIVEFNEEGRIVEHSLFDKFFLSLVITLVALGSFGLGILYGTGERGPVKIIEPSDTAEAEISNYQLNSANQTANTADSLNTNQVVVSKNGSKYHYLYCPGAKQIKDENKIIFDSAEAAEQAGYTLAGNCSVR